MAPDEIADHLEMFAAKGAGAGALSSAGQAAAAYLDRPGVLAACLAFDAARLGWEAHGRPWQAVAGSARALAGVLRATHVVSAGLDPRWEWIEVGRLDKPGPEYIKGPCRHTEVVPVESAGEVVAQLCLTCDTQLPAPR